MDQEVYDVVERIKNEFSIDLESLVSDYVGNFNPSIREPEIWKFFKYFLNFPEKDDPEYETKFLISYREMMNFDYNAMTSDFHDLVDNWVEQNLGHFEDSFYKIYDEYSNIKHIVSSEEIKKYPSEIDNAIQDLVTKFWAIKAKKMLVDKADELFEYILTPEYVSQKLKDEYKKHHLEKDRNVHPDQEMLDIYNLNKSNKLSGHLDPIAYITNGGEYLCPSCAEKAYGLDESGRWPQQQPDGSPNPIAPWDEWYNYHEDDAPYQMLTCVDCGETVDDFLNESSVDWEDEFGGLDETEIEAKKKSYRQAQKDFYNRWTQEKHNQQRQQEIKDKWEPASWWKGSSSDTDPLIIAEKFAAAFFRISLSDFINEYYQKSFLRYHSDEAAAEETLKFLGYGNPEWFKPFDDFIKWHINNFGNKNIPKNSLLKFKKDAYEIIINKFQSIIENYRINIKKRLNNSNKNISISPEDMSSEEYDIQNNKKRQKNIQDKWEPQSWWKGSARNPDIQERIWSETYDDDDDYDRFFNIMENGQSFDYFVQEINKVIDRMNEEENDAVNLIERKDVDYQELWDQWGFEYQSEQPEPDDMGYIPSNLYDLYNPLPENMETNLGPEATDKNEARKHRKRIIDKWEPADWWKGSKRKRVIAATPELIQEMKDKFYDLEQVIVESYVQQKNKSITVNPTNLRYWEKADIISDLVTDKRLLSNDLFYLEDEVHNFADSFVKRYNIKDEQVVKEKFIEAVEEEIYGIIDRYSRDIYDAIYEDAKRVGKTIASYFMDFDPAEVKSWPIAARLDEIKNIEEGHSNLLEYANMWDFDEVYSFHNAAEVLQEASLNSGYDDWSEGLDEGFRSNISVRKMEDSLGADARHLYEPVDPSREPYLGPEETDENEAKKHRRDIADKWKVDYDRSKGDRLNWATEEDFPKKPWDFTSKTSSPLDSRDEHYVIFKNQDDYGSDICKDCAQKYMQYLKPGDYIDFEGGSYPSLFKDEYPDEDDWWKQCDECGKNINKNWEPTEKEIKKSLHPILDSINDQLANRQYDKQEWLSYFPSAIPKIQKVLNELKKWVDKYPEVQFMEDWFGNKTDIFEYFEKIIETGAKTSEEWDRRQEKANEVLHQEINEDERKKKTEEVKEKWEPEEWWKGSHTKQSNDRINNNFYDPEEYLLAEYANLAGKSLGLNPKNIAYWERAQFLGMYERLKQSLIDEAERYFYNTVPEELRTEENRWEFFEYIEQSVRNLGIEYAQIIEESVNQAGYQEGKYFAEYVMDLSENSVRYWSVKDRIDYLENLKEGKTSLIEDHIYESNAYNELRAATGYIEEGEPNPYIQDPYFLIEEFYLDVDEGFWENIDEERLRAAFSESANISELYNPVPESREPYLGPEATDENEAKKHRRNIADKWKIQTERKPGQKLEWASEDDFPKKRWESKVASDYSTQIQKEIEELAKDVAPYPIDYMDAYKDTAYSDLEFVQDSTYRDAIYVAEDSISEAIWRDIYDYLESPQSGVSPELRELYDNDTDLIYDIEDLAREHVDWEDTNRYFANQAIDEVRGDIFHFVKKIRNDLTNLTNDKIIWLEEDMLLERYLSFEMNSLDFLGFLDEALNGWDDLSDQLNKLISVYEPINNYVYNELNKYAQDLLNDSKVLSLWPTVINNIERFYDPVDSDAEAYLGPKETDENEAKKHRKKIKDKWKIQTLRGSDEPLNWATEEDFPKKPWDFTSKWKIAGGFEDLYTQYYNQLEQNENQTKQLIEKYAFDVVLEDLPSMGSGFTVEKYPDRMEVVPNQLKMERLHDSWIDFTNHQKLLESLFPDWKKSYYSFSETRIIAIEEFINNKMPDLLQKMESMYNYISQGRLSGESDDEIRAGYEKHFQTKVSAMPNQFLPRLYHTMIENLKKTATFDWESEATVFEKVKVAYEILYNWYDYIDEIKEESGYNGPAYDLDSFIQDAFIDIFTPIFESLMYIDDDEIHSQFEIMHNNVRQTAFGGPYAINNALYEVYTETGYELDHQDHPKWTPSDIVDFYENKPERNEQEEEELRRYKNLDKWEPESWWKGSKRKIVAADEWDEEEEEEEEKDIRDWSEIDWMILQEVQTIDGDSIVTSFLEDYDWEDIVFEQLVPLGVWSDEAIFKKYVNSLVNNSNPEENLAIEWATEEAGRWFEYFVETAIDFYINIEDQLTTEEYEEHWADIEDTIRQYLWDEAHDYTGELERRAEIEINHVLGGYNIAEAFFEKWKEQRQREQNDRNIHPDQEMMDLYNVKGELPEPEPASPSPQVVDWMRQQSKTASQYENWSTPETEILVEQILSDSRILRPSIKTMEKIVRQGGSVQDLANWMIENVLNPYNQGIAQNWENISDEQDVEAQKNELRKTWKQQARKQFPFSLQKQKQYVQEMEQMQFGFFGEPEPEDIERYLLKVENINWQEIYDWVKEDLQYRGKIASHDDYTDSTKQIINKIIEEVPVLLPQRAGWEASRILKAWIDRYNTDRLNKHYDKEKKVWLDDDGEIISPLNTYEEKMIHFHQTEENRLINKNQLGLGIEQLRTMADNVLKDEVYWVGSFKTELQWLILDRIEYYMLELGYLEKKIILKDIFDITNTKENELIYNNAFYKAWDETFKEETSSKLSKWKIISSDWDEEEAQIDFLLNDHEDQVIEESEDLKSSKNALVADNIRFQGVVNGFHNAQTALARINYNELNKSDDYVEPDRHYNPNQLELFRERLRNNFEPIIVGEGVRIIVKNYTHFFEKTDIPNDDWEKFWEILEQSYKAGWEYGIVHNYIDFNKLNNKEIINIAKKTSSHGQRQMAIGDEVAETTFEGIPDSIEEDDKPEEKVINNKKWKIVRPKHNPQPAEYARPKGQWGMYSKTAMFENSEFTDSFVREKLIPARKSLPEVTKKEAIRKAKQIWEQFENHPFGNAIPGSSNEQLKYLVDDIDLSSSGITQETLNNRFYDPNQVDIFREKRLKQLFEKGISIEKFYIYYLLQIAKEALWNHLFNNTMPVYEMDQAEKELMNSLSNDDKNNLYLIFKNTYHEEFKRLFNGNKTSANKKDAWEAVLDGEMGHDILTTGSWEEVKKQTLKWLKQLKDGYINKENPHDNEKIDSEAKEQDGHAMEDLKLYEEKKRWSFHFDHGKHPYDLIIQPVGYKESNNNWRHGDCDLFAIKKHQETGWPIYKIAEGPNDGAWHFFLINPETGEGLDGDGLRPVEEILQEHDPDFNPEYEELGIYPDVFESSLKEAINYRKGYKESKLKEICV